MLDLNVKRDFQKSPFIKQTDYFPLFVVIKEENKGYN